MVKLLQRQGAHFDENFIMSAVEGFCNLTHLTFLEFDDILNSSNLDIYQTYCVRKKIKKTFLSDLYGVEIWFIKYVTIATIMFQL